MRLLVTSALLLAAPLLAQQFPEIEPNDIPIQAQVVALGTQINSNLSIAGDNDYYVFTTPGGYHGINTSGGATVATDTIITLFDSTGTTVLHWNDDSQSLCSNAWMNLSAGTYLVRVTGFAGTAVGLYSIDFSHVMSKPLNGAESEPNDTIALANAVADGAQIGSSLTPPVLAVTTDLVGPAGAVLASNSVVSSTTTVITTTGLLAGAYNGAGYLVTMTSGANVGLSRRTTANTATTITTEAWPVAPAAADTFDIVNNSQVLSTDTVISATTTVITQTTPVVASFYTPAAAYSMRMTSGPNAGLSRTITTNTLTTITTAAWPVANTAGNTFEVVSGGSTASLVVATPLVAGQYNDQAFWLRCTSGANAGLTRCILRNTAGVVVMVVGFTTAPLPGDTFVIDQYDVDTYRVDVTAPLAEVVFSVTGGNDNFVSAWSYAVVDGAGNRINALLFGANLADSGNNQHLSSFRVWSTGTYYVRIMQRRTALVAPANQVPYGNYRFELKQKDMNVGGVFLELELPGGNTNNTIFTAETIAPGQRASGNITNSIGLDPSDWWGPINITSQSLIAFQVSQGSGSPIADASLNLRQVVDPILGTTAASLLTGGNILETGSLNPRGIFNFLLPGTIYYLEVLSPGTGATQAGDYVLDISIVDVPTYAAGNWAVIASNAAGCGTAGVPTINRVQGNALPPAALALFGELPIVGETLVTRTTNLNGVGNLGLIVIGPGGPSGPVYNPTPLDIGFLGAPGCFLNVDPMIIDLLVGDITGTADYVIPCPGNLALAGTALFMQPCKWDFGTPINALGIQPGNFARVIFGTRTF